MSSVWSRRLWRSLRRQLLRYPLFLTLWVCTEECSISEVARSTRTAEESFRKQDPFRVIGYEFICDARDLSFGLGARGAL